MSLEDAILKHAEALNRLADAIETNSLPPFVKERKAEEKAEAKEEKKPAPKAEAKEEKKAPAKKAPAKKEAPKKEEPAEDEDIHQKEYYVETVQPTTRKAAKALGREAVIGILDEFGSNLETAKDLEEGQWEDYVARLEEEIAAADDGEDMA